MVAIRFALTLAILRPAIINLNSAKKDKKMSHNVYSVDFDEILIIGNRQKYINNKCYTALKEIINMACDIFELATTKQISHELYTTLLENLKKIQKPLIKIEEITDHEKSVFEEFLMRKKERTKKC